MGRATKHVDQHFSSAVDGDECVVGLAIRFSRQVTTAHTATINVTTGFRIEGGIANSAAVDIHMNIAVAIVRSVHVSMHIHTGRSQTSTTIDVALQQTVVHNNFDVAYHTACRSIGVQVVTSTAEDVAVPRGGAISANETAFKSDRGIAQHVGIRAAAEERTIDTAIGFTVPV